MPGAVSIESRPIRSKVRYKGDIVRTRILTLMKKYQKLALADYYSTCDTWENHHPDFIVIARGFTRQVGGVAGVVVGLDDDGSEDAEVWKKINEGEPQKLVQLSRNWYSKTWPGRLKAEIGQGYVEIPEEEFIEMGLTPNPPIEPRNFDQQIKDLRQPQFQAEVLQAVRDTFRK